MGGGNLQIGIHRGADRQATAEKLILAKVRAQLTTDFIGEIVAWRQGGAEPFDLASLHGQQVRRSFPVQGVLIDIAILEHLAQRVIAPENCLLAIAHRMAIGGGLGQ